MSLFRQAVCLWALLLAAAGPMPAWMHQQCCHGLHCAAGSDCGAGRDCVSGNCASGGDSCHASASDCPADHGYPAESESVSPSNRALTANTESPGVSHSVCSPGIVDGWQGTIAAADQCAICFQLSQVAHQSAATEQLRSDVMACPSQWPVQLFSATRLAGCCAPRGPPAC